MLAVVDAWESMTTGRPYRDPLQEAEAMAELRRCAGTQFDPRVVEEFERLVSEESGAGSGLRVAAPGTTTAGRPDAVR